MIIDVVYVVSYVLHHKICRFWIVTASESVYTSLLGTICVWILLNKAKVFLISALMWEHRVPAVWSLKQLWIVNLIRFKIHGMRLQTIHFHSPEWSDNRFKAMVSQRNYYSTYQQIDSLDASLVHQSFGFWVYDTISIYSPSISYSLPTRIQVMIDDYIYMQNGSSPKWCRVENVTLLYTLYISVYHNF